MTGFPNRQTVEQLQEQFKSGITMELTSPMDDPYHPLPAGLRGECCGVGDAGQIMMIWSDGSTLSLIPGVESFRIVKELLKEEGFIKNMMTAYYPRKPTFNTAKLHSAVKDRGSYRIKITP